MKLTNHDLNVLCETAMDAAKLAGGFIRANADKNIAVQNKSGADSLASQVVTEIDVKAQEIILEKLAPTLSKYNLALLTEESIDDKSRFEKDYFWCIDPMDGTLPFTEKKPGYAVSIALVSKTGEPQIGVVFDPVTQILYHAIKGQGAFKNQKNWNPDLSIKNKTDFTLQMDRSFVDHKNYDFILDEMTTFIQSLGITGLKIQNIAGAVLNAIWVLENAPGCYFKLPKLEPGGGSLWDFAATTCIFNETGGFISDCFGAPLELNRNDSTYMNHKGVLFASQKEIRDKIIGLYKRLSD